MNLEVFLKKHPIVDIRKKDCMLLEYLSCLTQFHYENCKENKNLLNTLKWDCIKIRDSVF